MRLRSGNHRCTQRAYLAVFVDKINNEIILDSVTSMVVTRRRFASGMGRRSIELPEAAGRGRAVRQFLSDCLPSVSS